MTANLLTFTKEQFAAFKLGMAQQRPVHLLTCFDGDNITLVERRYPIDPLPYRWSLAKQGEGIPVCIHCKHPLPRWYLMNERDYGPKTYLCGNCEQLSYFSHVKG